jgi:hypothetical protein
MPRAAFVSRPVNQPAFIQRGHDPSHLLIEALDHRGIDLAVCVRDVRVAFHMLRRMMVGRGAHKDGSARASMPIRKSKRNLMVYR